MLIQIANKHASPPISLAEKFFLVGIIAGFIGSAYLGSYLWLMRTAEVPIASNYKNLRGLHALIQIYLFLGLFILGFTFHALPRVLQTRIHASKYLLLVLLLPLLALVLFLTLPNQPFYRWPLCLAFAVACCFVVYLSRHASTANTLLFIPAMLVGLLSLGLGATTDLGDLRSVLVIFWIGVGSIVFATGQQFISAFVGGQKLGVVSALLLWVLMLLAAGFAWYSKHRYFGLICLSISAYYILRCKLYRGVFNLATPIACAFVCAHIWLVIGAINLIIAPSSLDYTLHLWATGWTTTLIIGTSSQIISFLSHKPLLPRLPMLLIIVLWQLVPIGRGLGALMPLPAWSSWVVAASAVVVFSVWGGRLLVCACALMLSQIRPLSTVRI